MDITRYTKTCTQGELTERMRKCMCKSLPQQLCPFHCMQDTLILTQESFDRRRTSLL